MFKRVIMYQGGAARSTEVAGARGKASCLLFSPNIVWERDRLSIASAGAHSPAPIWVRGTIICTENKLAKRVLTLR